MGFICVVARLSWRQPSLVPPTGRLREKCLQDNNGINQECMEALIDNN